MKIRVVTVCVKTGEQFGESRIINYKHSRERQWLAKHTIWAFNNGYGVATNNIEAE